MKIWRMRIACWVPNATCAHLACVIFIALPLQQWLHERASMLRYTYIGCLVKPSLRSQSKSPCVNLSFSLSTRDIVSATELLLDFHEILYLSWCFSDRASWIDYILITNLMHWLLFIHKILFSSTCFESQVLIFRRIQLYTCSI